MENKVYWIIQTRKWRVEDSEDEFLDDDRVQDVMSNLEPAWERIEVVIDTDSVPQPKEA